jgi:phage tail-like protein
VTDALRPALDTNVPQLLCTVSHVASAGHCYPGEEVTLRTRLQPHGPVPPLRLRVWIPDGLVPVRFGAPGKTLPSIAPSPGGRQILWDLDPAEREPSYEFEVVARVEPTAVDRILQTRASIEMEGEGDGRASIGETAALAVAAKGRYLRYLPALYERDELMARFLMLFESFWGPIEQRIEHMHLYFNPWMAPAEVLPWLASWLGLVLDEHWSEAQRRQLIASAASLYRKRGTPQGLLEYLSILGEEVRIIEHRANNLVLGAEVKLGQSIALGTENVPHTFTVVLSGGAPSAGAGDVQFDAEFDARLRRIKAAIEAEKPAHTGYTVRFEAGPDVRHREG